MEKLPKRAQRITTAEVLGLDLNDAANRNYLCYEKLLLALRRIMIKQGVSGNMLAKKMGVSRQAVYDRFAGRNTTLEWIARVAAVLGIGLKVTLIEPPREVRKVA